MIGNFKKIKYLLIIISVIMFNLSLYLPDYFFWLSFIFLSPIFYLSVNKDLDFKSGFVWGFFFNIIHFYYLLIIIYDRGYGWFKYPAFFILIIYFSFFAGVWFWLLSLVKYKNMLISVFHYLIITWLYFIFIYKYIFLIFGINCGYVLSFPILPLVNILNNLIELGSTFLLLILISFSFLITLTFIYKKFFLTFITCIASIFFFYLLKKESYAKNNFLNFAHISSPNSKNRSAYGIGYEIKHRIIDSVNNNPEIKLILMSESAFPFALNEYPEIIKSWFVDIDTDIHILIGAHRSNNNKLYNCLYHLKNSNIVDFYDKTNLVPFVEYIPIYFKRDLFNQLFLKDCKEFSFGNINNICFKINNFKLVPFICSDIFLDKKIKKNENIILFLNESWFTSNYIIKLMSLLIKLKSIENHAEIIPIWNQN